MNHSFWPFFTDNFFFGFSSRSVLAQRLPFEILLNEFRIALSPLHAKANQIITYSAVFEADILAMPETKLRNALLVFVLHALGSNHILFSQAWHPRYTSYRHCSVGKPSQSIPTELYSIGNDDSKDDNGSTVEEYRNVATQVLSNFMQKDAMENAQTERQESPIDFAAPKIAPTTPLETLAAALDYELTEKEWFVTGNVNPSYFSPSFRFQDPDVKVESIEDYSKGVKKIFNQSTARAEILSVVVNEEASSPDKPIITIAWRLSGGVNIGFGLDIKPYVVYTDFVIDPATSLIVFQEDRFDIPSWDILLR
jgi:hypothetical protein